MASPEQLKQKELNEKRLTNRLRLATTRLQNAQQEHVWAIAAAKSEGLSIRKIAAATGLSSSRVHQVLHTEESGVKHRRRLAEPEPELSSLSQREQRAILREKMGLSPY